MIRHAELETGASRAQGRGSVVDVIFQACQLAASARIDVRKMLAKRKDIATDGRIEKLTAYRPVKLTYSSNVGGDVR